MEILGIDIGGSGIKGAPVDTESGKLLAERMRIPTPPQAKPVPVAQAVSELTQLFEWRGPIGVGFPAVIRGGIAYSAANVHKKWIGANAAALFAEATRCPVTVLNDADAAGLAEMTFGAGNGRKGVVMVVTIGTGLGTSLFTDGHLVPNVEMGHIEINGLDAELRASDAARQRDKLSWKKWARRLDEYLDHIKRLVWPDLIILGGGVIKQYEKFLPLLTVDVELTTAQFMNDAGVVGAALAARNRLVSGEPEARLAHPGNTAPPPADVPADPAPQVAAEVPADQPASKKADKKKARPAKNPNHAAQPEAED